MVERLIPFLFLSLSPTKSSKQQDAARTWDTLLAGLHVPTLTELDIFIVRRALPSIIDWSTTQDTIWAYTVLLATLLG